MLTLLDSIGGSIERILPKGSMGAAQRHDTTMLTQTDAMERGVPDDAEHRQAASGTLILTQEERERLLHSRLMSEAPQYAPVVPRPIRQYHSPLGAFAQSLLPEAKPYDGSPVPFVAYRSANAQYVPAVQLDEQVFLVHGALDAFYREPLMRILENTEVARSYAYEQTVVQQDLEEDQAALYERRPFERDCFRTSGKYSASDWVVYTHPKSRLMNEMRSVLTRDGRFDYYEDATGTVNLFDIRTIPHRVVAFFCSSLPAFQAPAAVAAMPPTRSATPDNGRESDDTASPHATVIPMLPEEDNGGVWTLQRHLAHFTTIPVTGGAQDESEWFAVPVWLVTLLALRARDTTATNNTTNEAARQHTPNGAAMAGHAKSWLDTSFVALYLNEAIAALPPQTERDVVHVNALRQRLLETLKLLDNPDALY